MAYIGTRWSTTQLTLVDTEYVLTINPIVVHAVVLTYNGAGKRIATLLDNDSNIYMLIQQDNRHSAIFHTSWLAGNGLKFLSADNSNLFVYISVLYSQGIL